MTNARIDAALARLASRPANPILRMAVVRSLDEAGETAQAVAAAFELEAGSVASAADRALLADLFAKAGLDKDAARWRDGAEAPTPQPAAVAAPEADEAAAEGDTDDPVPPPRRGFRVIEGMQERPVPDPGAEAGPVTRFADVGGLAQVKRDIERRIIAPFRASGLVARFRRKAGGGVLLYGPPGCGKTLIARATAGECGASFHAIHASDILSKYYGESEERIAAIFAKARADTPSVLFFDEVDALAMKRSDASSSHVAQLVTTMLVEIDGAGTRNDGVLVLAATNLPWSLDAAFLRPGRFDRLFFVPPPDRAAREAILRLELAERPQAPGLDVTRLAAKTSGFSGADLAAVVERAADIAIDATLEQDRVVAIDQRMLDAALGQVRSSVTDWLTTARNHATYANESGRYDDVLAFLRENGR